MSKPISKEDVVIHKKQAIKKLNNLLEMYINNPSEQYLKKANLISYWLESFSDYVKDEEMFDSTKLISYKRGNIIKANFGFNIGSEQGGLHYAVVLDNNNHHGSPVVTVIPLSSGTEDTTYPEDVFLGQELFSKINSKADSLLSKATKKLEENLRLAKVLDKALSDTDTDTDSESKQLLQELRNRSKSIQSDINLYKKYVVESNRMKSGSIALVGQITTISKMRIYVPKNSKDILYNISLSPEGMNKINERIKELYLFNK